MGNELEIIQKETKTLKEQANALKIVSQVEYEGTGTFLKAVKALQKRIKATFDPIVAATNKAHKESTQKRKEHLDPTVEAEKIVKEKLAIYDTEQEIIRQAQEEKLRKAAEAEERRKKAILEERARKEEEKAKKLREEAAKADAEEKEKLEAQAKKAEEKAEANREKKEDVIVEAPVLAPRAETPKGISYRTVYYGEVENKAQVPEEYKMVNMGMVNKTIQAQKGKIPIPGIRILDRKEVASRSK